MLVVALGPFQPRLFDEARGHPSLARKSLLFGELLDRALRAAAPLAPKSRACFGPLIRQVQRFGPCLNTYALRAPCKSCRRRTLGSCDA
jgi:hypothetical protein